MSENPRQINFIKPVISNQTANETLDRGFEEFAKSPIPIDENSIKKMYSEVFYNLPKKGKESHTTVIELSEPYVRRQYTQKLESEVKNLSEDLEEIENKLTLLETPSLTESPIYDDGTFLQVGEGGLPHDGMDDVYIVQEGRRRKFVNDEIYNHVRRSFQLPEDKSGMYFTSVNDLNNNVPPGPDIAGFSDLLLSGDDLKVDQPDILGLSAYTQIQLTCKGNEVSDYLNSYIGFSSDSYNAEDYQTNYDNLVNLQFYLNEDPCRVSYIVDDFYNDEAGPVVSESIIQPGETLTIKILRDSVLGNNNIPNNMNQYYDQFPTLNINYNNNDINNYIREWGPSGKYNSIVYAEGRILYKEVYSEYLHGSPPNGLGIAYSFSTEDGYEGEDSPLIFNGLPTGNTGTWGINEDITLIDYNGYTGQELSNYGTKMLYKENGLFGSLGQESALQEFCFDKPDCHYYKRAQTTFGEDYAVYGQPIIRYNNKYYVFLFAYKAGNGGNRVRMLNIMNGTIDRYRKGQIEDVFGEDNVDFDNNKVRWEELNVYERLKYKGLQGWKPNSSYSSDNPFNTSLDGSNYG